MEIFPLDFFETNFLNEGIPVQKLPYDSYKITIFSLKEVLFEIYGLLV